MPGIYHITTRVDWDAAVEAGVYAPDSLDNEGTVTGVFDFTPRPDGGFSLPPGLG